MTRTSQPTSTPRESPTTQERPPEAGEKFLRDRLERVILEGIRHATSLARGGMTDLDLDYLFGKKQGAAKRETILQRLVGLNLVACSKTPRGGRIWIAIYPRKGKVDDAEATTNNSNGEQKR